MKSKKILKPLVSFIIPVYNEEKRIKGCLESLYSQTFKDFEVLIIDDDSTDKTLDIVKKFPVKIFRNGKKDYDIGKAIGIKNAKGRFLIFIDADNRLIDKKWLEKGIRILKKDEKVIGVQSWRFFYSKNHNFATRYQDLFGNLDPFVFYLKSQDHLMNYENKWKLKGKIIENTQDYIIIKFKKSEIPTLGSQGFLTRKEYFKEEKIFQHIEFFINKAEKGNFCFLKNEVEHIGVKNVREIIRKFGRNIEHYLEDIKKSQQERYSLNIFKIAKTFFIMISLAIPLYDSLIGYIHIKDKVWFLHIFLSFIVPWIYAWKVIWFKLI